MNLYSFYTKFHHPSPSIIMIKNWKYKKPVLIHKIPKKILLNIARIFWNKNLEDLAWYHTLSKVCEMSKKVSALYRLTLRSLPILWPLCEPATIELIATACKVSVFQHSFSWYLLDNFPIFFTYWFVEDPAAREINFLKKVKISKLCF